LTAPEPGVDLGSKATFSLSDWAERSFRDGVRTRDDREHRETDEFMTLQSSL
jgi:hypothetical protein